MIADLTIDDLFAAVSSQTLAAIVGDLESQLFHHPDPALRAVKTNARKVLKKRTASWSKMVFAHRQTPDIVALRHHAEALVSLVIAGMTHENSLAVRNKCEHVTLAMTGLVARAATAPTVETGE